MMQNLSHAVMAQRHEPVTSLDLFPTPPWATRALMEELASDRMPKLWKAESVWEPAAGFGDMVKPLMEYFGTVYASDVHPHVVRILASDGFRLAANGLERPGDYEANQ